MREIKFRGKRIDNGEWVVGDLLKPNGSCRIVNYEYSPNEMGVCIDFHYFDVEEESVGQYIGLKDKNGNEILEGDIVENKWNEIGVVVLYNGGWSIKWDEDEIHFLFAELEDYIEVVGNVVDNKYLLSNK